MNVNEFIEKHVNMNRGGYKPEEVVELIQRAWEKSKYETLIGIAKDHSQQIINKYKDDEGAA